MIDKSSGGIKILRLVEKTSSRASKERLIMKVEMIESILRSMKYESESRLDANFFSKEIQVLIPKSRQIGITPTLISKMVPKFEVPPDQVAGWLLYSWEAKYQRINMEMFNFMTRGGASEHSIYPIISTLEKLESPEEKKAVKTASDASKFGV